MAPALNVSKSRLSVAFHFTTWSTDGLLKLDSGENDSLTNFKLELVYWSSQNFYILGWSID